MTLMRAYIYLSTMLLTVVHVEAVVSRPYQEAREISTKKSQVGETTAKTEEGLSEGELNRNYFLDAEPYLGERQASEVRLRKTVTELLRSQSIDYLNRETGDLQEYSSNELLNDGFELESHSTGLRMNVFSPLLLNKIEACFQLEIPSDSRRQNWDYLQCEFEDQEEKAI